MVKPLPEELKKAHLYLLFSSEEAEKKSKKETLRKELLPWLQTLEQDEDGNYFYEFPDPILEYKGLKAQRRVSEYANEEKARELIIRHALEDRCIEVVTDTVVDYDELYACNQEGIISDEEIDSIIEVDVTYALVKIK